MFKFITWMGAFIACLLSWLCSAKVSADFLHETQYGYGFLWFLITTMCFGLMRFVWKKRPPL